MDRSMQVGSRGSLVDVTEKGNHKKQTDKDFIVHFPSEETLRSEKCNWGFAFHFILTYKALNTKSLSQSFGSPA